MEDLKKDVSEIINERLKSPILGAFVIAWISWNWRVFIYIFLDASDDGENVDFILENYLNDPMINLWYPLLVALIYPGLSYLAFIYSEFINSKKTLMNFKIHERTPIDLNQKMDLLSLTSRQKTEYEKLLNEKEIEIEKLKVAFEQSSSGRKNLLSDIKAREASYKQQISEKDKDIADLKEVIAQDKIDKGIDEDKFFEIYNIIDSEDEGEDLISKLGSLAKGKYFEFQDYFGNLDLFGYTLAKKLVSESPISGEKIKYTKLGWAYNDYHNKRKVSEKNSKKKR